jgi:hypothetical protein
MVLPLLLSAQGALFGAMALLTTQGFSLALILALVAVDGLAGIAARTVLKATVVSCTEPRGLLREANALLTMAFTVCMAGGPVVAGALVGFTSPTMALATDAASFAAAAVLLASSRLPRLASPTEESSGGVREAIAHVRSRAGLPSLLAASGGIAVLGSAVLPLEVVLVTKVLESSEAAYGIVLSLWGLGAALGSALLPLLRRYPPVTLMAGSFVIFAASYVGMGTAGSLAAVCVFSLIGGLGNGVEVYATMTAVQERTAEAFQTRVGGFLESILAAAAGAGFLLGGAIAVLLSVRLVFVASGVGILFITVLLLSPATARAARTALAAVSRRTARAT